MPLDIVTIRHYIEQPRIIDQRHNYLKRMMRNCEEKCPVFYSMRRWSMHMMEKTRHGWRKTQSLMVQLAELNVPLVMGNV